MLLLFTILLLAGCQEKAVPEKKSPREMFASFKGQLVLDTTAMKALQRQVDALHSLQAYVRGLASKEQAKLSLAKGLEEHFKPSKAKRFQALGFSSRKEEMFHIFAYHDLLEKVIKFYKDNNIGITDQEIGVQILYKDIAESSNATPPCDLYCHYGNVACETAAENEHARNYQWCNMGRTNCCYDIGQPDECCFEQSCYASADMWYSLSLQSCFESYKQCINMCQDQDEY